MSIAMYKYMKPLQASTKSFISDFARRPIFRVSDRVDFSYFILVAKVGKHFFSVLERFI